MKPRVSYQRSSIQKSLQGDFFMCPEWGSYQEYMWDATADEKFEVTEPEAKKQRREE